METPSVTPVLKPLWHCDPRDGRDELNLAEFPLATIATRAAPGQKTLSFEDEIWDEGARQQIKRRLMISGSDQFGLPTARDNDVLLALIHLTRCRNQFADPTVYFTRYELTKFLRWDDGGKSYRRLERSLNVLASVTLFYNRAWWDRAGKSWRNRTFHILETVDLRGRGAAGAGEQPLSSFTWNQNVFLSFTSNYIKKLNLEVYFQLRSAAARQAYRFLDKRFYHKRKLEFEIRGFACEHLGFNRSYDTAQLKRNLQPAIQELEAIGFLEPRPSAERFVKQARGLWTIRLERRGEPNSRKPAEGQLSDLAKRLIERGVNMEAARELAASSPGDEIEKTLATFDALPQRVRERIKNPGGYLVRAIRRPWEPARSSDSQPFPPPLKNAEPPSPPVDRKKMARDALWNSFSASERSSVEAAAFTDADAFIVNGLQRAEENGSKAVAAGYRQAILDRELDRLVGEKNQRLRTAS